MEDVVLHYQSGSVEALSSLLQRTEQLLESFPCRPPPLFVPWFPSDRCPPIRPAKPPPVITCAGDCLAPDSRPHATGKQPQKTAFTEKPHNPPPSETTGSPPEKSERGDGVFCISETPNHLLPGAPPVKHAVTGTALIRSWSVFTQRGLFPQSRHPLSKQFDHMVSVHRLHLRQRAKWVITGDNCGSARDIEQVWRTLSRCVRSGELPTCNANIQRDVEEIWVFCDVLCSEQVGRLLKDELQLSGRIVLQVHQRGNVFSL